MQIEIDRDGCISCGLCVDICPSVFRIADDGLSEVYAAPDAGNESAAQDAADSCPVSVIHVTQ